MLHIGGHIPVDDLSLPSLHNLPELEAFDIRVHLHPQRQVI
jgi:hypothetical protein